MGSDAYIVIVLSLLLSALFSGTEIAFLTANKLKIELDKNQGIFTARLLSRFINKPSALLGTVLLGNNIALVVYGLAIEPVLDKTIKVGWGLNQLNEASVLVIQTLLSTLIILFLAEFLPKALFRLNPNKILNWVAFPVFVVYILLYPIVYLFISTSELILYFFLGSKLPRHAYEYSPVDLDHFIREFTESKPSDDLAQEIQMFQNVLDFKEIKLRECMVPRPYMVAIPLDTPITEANKRFIDTGHSKLLVFSHTIDDIIGYIHSFDMFSNPLSIQNVLRPVMLMPESMQANKALKTLIQEKKSVAVVMDEFGGTSGMVTVEDLIEEIVGEINDEFDTSKIVEKQLNDNEYIFSARAEIDHINQKFNLNLPVSEEYETLGGLIIHIHEAIPLQGDEIDTDDYTFKIIQSSDKKIDKVKLMLK
jgi:CBS domain containing-hemolysin-like protein